MNFDLETLAVTFGAVAVLVIYDIVVLVTKGYASTISANARLMAMRYPIVAFALGVVIGHLWWAHGDCVIKP